MDWLQRIKNNADAALKEVYAEHRNECISWLIKEYDVDIEMCKEVFQASVVILYDNVIKGKLEVLNSNLKSYLFGIAKNKLRELLRTERRNQKRLSQALIHQHLITNESIPERVQKLMDGMDNILNKLGEPCMSLLRLFYLSILSGKPVTKLTQIIFFAFHLEN